jgi:sugar phosphate isomerase/epimerase
MRIAGIYERQIIMKNAELSRRSFIGGTAALSAATMLPNLANAAKPNSKFNGVQIGVNTGCFVKMSGGSAEHMLKYIIQCGISSVEFRSPEADQYARAYAKTHAGADPMDAFRALRKLYNDAGVTIHILRVSTIGIKKMSTKTIEYYFNAAKALGAKAIARGHRINKTAAKRLGPIADKHEMMLGFHNHTEIRPDTYDGDILSYGKYLGIQLDVGHYVAGTNQSAIPMIEKFHDRIIALHLNDRKKNKGLNMPWGQGDTDPVGILQFLKKNKLTFPADIELAYQVPQGSDAVKEVTKCLQFCKQALA